MSQEISIILARASWCPHCKDFEPIFENAKGGVSDFDDLKKEKLHFEDYDFADDDVKNKFMLSHFKAMDKISGYPTVLINIKNKSLKTNEYIPIEHSILNEKDGSKEKQLNEASKRFLSKVVSTLKTLKSDGKVKYIQQGGTQQGVSNNYNNKTSLKEESYREKYLKYKSKYLKLKEQM
jgi:thiol-disulfide isomerase/thioredoxin